VALLKTKDIRAMTPEERESKLKDLRGDLMHERGVAAMGGAPKNPGKIQALRRNISRVLTIIREEERMNQGVRKGGK
jgi:large subunit ribosomal protein L29